MRQRLLIAIAVALSPAVLLADEPTTALDVTVQAQIMQLLQDLREERDMAVVLITHDLALVSEQADRVVVMYAGNVVEQGPVDEVFGSPEAPLHARGCWTRCRSRPSAAPTSSRSAARRPSCTPSRQAASTRTAARWSRTSAAPTRPRGRARSPAGHASACHFPEEVTA